jgi:hypothetical protein
MPKTDDVELIVLKGHLLVERVLNDLADAVLPNPKFLPDKLSFYQLAHIVRAAVPQRSDDPCWELIIKLNTLRNDLAHKLESPKRAGTLNELFKIHDRVQPAPEMIVDKSAEQMLGESDPLRLVIEDSMKFLLAHLTGNGTARSVKCMS